MKETQAALDRVVAMKIQAAQPTSLAPEPGAPTFIKYTPAQQGSQYNSGAAHRIVKMQDMPVDPMEPPKFRAKKVLPLADCFLLLAASHSLLAWSAFTAAPSF